MATLLQTSIDVISVAPVHQPIKYSFRPYPQKDSLPLKITLWQSQAHYQLLLAQQHILPSINTGQLLLLRSPTHNITTRGQPILMLFRYLPITHQLLCILPQHMPLTLPQSLLCIPTYPSSPPAPIYCTLPTHYPRRHIPPHHSCRNFCHRIQLPLTPFYTSNLLPLRRPANSPTNTINALTLRTQLHAHPNPYP